MQLLQGDLLPRFKKRRNDWHGYGLPNGENLRGVRSDSQEKYVPD